MVALERIDRARDRQIGLAGAGRADAEGDVVGLDLLQIFDLARRAAVQIGAPRFELRRVAVIARRPRARHFDQAQLHVFHRQVVSGLGIEFFECLRRKLRVIGLAGQRKALAAARDHDVERGFDLAQVFVEHAAQIGEPLVVDRRKCDTSTGFKRERAQSRRAASATARR